jgi:hypothetical protein
MTVDGIYFHIKKLDLTREQDGITLPYFIRSLCCHPGAPIQLIQDNVDLKECVSDSDQKILTQFLKDAKDFDEKLVPEKIIDFINIIEFGSKADECDYRMKVKFMPKDSEKILCYDYSIPHGLKKGSYLLKWVAC